MNGDDKAELITAIMAIAEMHGKAPSRAALEIYWRSLHYFTLEGVLEAIATHVQDPDRGRFMPMPADIIKHLGRRRGSLEAWLEVERAMMVYGSYRTVRFEDPLTNAVLKDLGGWPWVCAQNINEPWTQKEFERRYDAYAGSGAGSEDALPGLHEQHNRTHGYLDEIRPPLLVSAGLEKKLIPAHLCDQKRIPESSNDQAMEARRRFQLVVDGVIQNIGQPSVDTP